MTTLHEKVTYSISHITRIAQFRNNESSIKNTVNGLDYLYNSKYQCIASEYINVVIGFFNYVKNNKIHVAEHIEMYNLAKLITLLKHPPTKFTIGTKIIHNVSKSVNEHGIIDDYDHKLNLYQIKYNNGKIVAWISEKNIQMA